MHSTSSAWACDARHETTTMSHETCCCCCCLMGGGWLSDGFDREENARRAQDGASLRSRNLVGDLVNREDLHERPPTATRRASG
eukprot:scaffold38978_cov48-Phaeocystis_antarctica.AAC.2